MDAFGRIVEIIVTAVLLFLVPLNYMAQKQDIISQSYVMSETAYLVDSVRNLGYLSKSMYETYLGKLRETNHVYRVELNHYSKRADREEGTENYRYHYYGIYTEDILDSLYSEENHSALYRFSQGDFFQMSVKNQDKTLASKIGEAILGQSISGPQIAAVYGGGIRDEIY